MNRTFTCSPSHSFAQTYLKNVRCLNRNVSVIITSLLLFIFGVTNVHADNNLSEVYEKPINNNNAPWFEVAKRNIVTFETFYGDVVIALHPTLAPTHVARFKALINAGFYDNQSFYRVIDGFVAQAGSNDGHDKSKFDDQLLSPLNAEFTQPLSSNAQVIEDNDMFAPKTGFIDGFPVGIDEQKKEMWGLHCPGVVAFARNSEKDMASTEFYIVIGQAPRHLDRNMSVVGRVVEGMQILQKLPRGDLSQGGVLKNITDNSKIKRAYVHNENNTPYFIQTTHHEEFKKRVHTGKNLDNPFFHDNSYGPRPIDVCYYQTKSSTSPW